MTIYTTSLNIETNTIDRHSVECDDEIDSYSNAANHTYEIEYPNVDFDDFNEDSIYAESIVSQAEADEMVFNYARSLMNKLYAALAKHGDDMK